MKATRPVLMTQEEREYVLSLLAESELSKTTFLPLANRLRAASRSPHYVGVNVELRVQSGSIAGSRFLNVERIAVEDDGTVTVTVPDWEVQG